MSRQPRRSRSASSIRSARSIGSIHRLAAERERPVVHRHEQPGPGGVGHRHRLLGRAVVADPRVVGANRHHRGRERTVAAMRGEGRRVGGVAADEQAPALAFDDEAAVAAMSVALDAGAPVLHLDGAHERVAARRRHRDRLVPAQLVHRRIVTARQQVGGGRGHHRDRPAADGRERRRVEVIEVGVRDQHQIDLGQRLRRQRALHEPQRARGCRCRDRRRCAGTAPDR